ncbi:hypothetical protein [Nocardioides sp.]|uniref:hypothetical protein n=1 Tax=Nocardioides sp. TaxID=35761 RepID=UPI00286E0365|nr:hypothetical protein [Nocardioides sp.]
MPRQDTSRRRRAVGAACATFLVPLALSTVSQSPAEAASSKGCDGGGFTVLGKGAGFEGTVPAPTGRFRVQGRYAQFDVDPADFAVYEQSFTGAANPLDQTGGRFTPIYASKVPDHRGLTLSSSISISIDDEAIQLSRTGTGLSMSLQAKDCASGGIFQMEPERGDGTRTRIVHRLADTAFYYDNPLFRARLGQFLGSGCASVETGPPGQFCVRVTPRVNIGNDISPLFAVRDSAQVATRILQAECGPDFTNALRLAETRDHCGGMSIWDVASGGRMGMVTGEDATEVANPPTVCVQNCQAQNQVRGRLANLGSPFPAPLASRLTPRKSTDGLLAPLTP